MTEKSAIPAVNRRHVLAGATALAGGLAAPGLLRAQPAPVKIGVVHPVTGWAQFSGTQCRFGAETAIAEINAAGGIASLGGAQIETVLGDAQSKPEIGATEVERFNEAGVSAIVGAYSSATAAATPRTSKRRSPRTDACSACASGCSPTWGRTS